MIFTAKTAHATLLSDVAVFGFGVDQFEVPIEECQPYIRTLKFFLGGKSKGDAGTFVSEDQRVASAFDRLREHRMLLEGEKSHDDLVEDLYFKNKLYLDIVTPDSNHSLSSLESTSVIIAGSGGIGNNVAFAFASLPINQMVLMDFDRVEESNLNRQFLFTQNDLGELKVEALKRRLAERFPVLHMRAREAKVGSDSLAIVLDETPGKKLVIVSADSQNIVEDTAAACMARGVAFLNVGYLNDIATIGPFWIPDAGGACPFCGGDSLGLSPNEQPDDVKLINRNYSAPSVYVNNATASAMAMSDVLSWAASDYANVMSLGRRVGINTRNFDKYEIALSLDPNCAFCARLQES
ncbi:ThiF family adenylyltransferase [Luteococcus sp.]|uniref:ThiF family adenylyltransferase n=1 Tax=Luteococcus sp. TaxID=1969402 RepID=UPI003736C974